MEGFQRCSNGHFYKEQLSLCPYCDKAENTESTQLAGSNGDMDKTQVFGGASGSNETEKSIEVNDSNLQNDKAKNSFEDLTKTHIGGFDDEIDESTGDVLKSTPRATRKMTGWLVSYSLDPMGVDYRIFEGNNTIGRELTNSIAITKDSTISSKHANILHKRGKFWIKDEMAANGTYLNGEEIEIEKAYPLKDGDDIRIGNTDFKFKSCF